MRKAAIILSVMMAFTARAQWDVPVPIVLTGPDDADRQVTGLADPLTPDAGMSVAAVRSLAVSFTEVSGTTTLAGTLTPAPSAYTAGMLVTIVPVEAHDAGATLDLNGLGPMPVTKGSGIPLDSADLAIGAPARLLFNGSEFVVVSNVPRPCKAGYMAISPQLCTETEPREATDLVSAAATCHANGGRLCRFAEWISACHSIPGFVGTITEAEWVDSAANHSDRAKTNGVGSSGLNEEGTGCQFGSHALASALHPFRCCMSR